MILPFFNDRKVLMELDPITKWLIRAASLMIILIGLGLVLAVPIVAFTISSKISVAQDSVKEALQLILQQLLV
tara:strand:- start:125 stop:343 length:219 start_codon:yes stop_codon:yes gene_type:complete